MQRSAIPVIVSSNNAWQDKRLWTIKSAIEQSYWSSNEGVFEFQFLSDNQPVTNTVSPHYFQLIRSTPDTGYDAFKTIIQGRLNSDGTIEYGGGKTGILTGKGIVWNDGSIWSRVNYMPPAGKDILDLATIQAQARLDSAVLMGGIYNNKYLY